MTLRVLLVGQEAAGAQLLRSVTESGHELVAVLTQEPSERGGPASLAALADRLGVPTFPSALVRDENFAAQMHAWSVDVLLNAHSLHVLAAGVLAAPSVGSFNLHPGPLPEYAGLNTVGWAIYQGEVDYGVTVHWMVPEIDAGPIAFEERFPLDRRATALSLGTECTRRGVALMERVLERAQRDPATIPRVAQDPEARTYYSRGSVPQGGRIDWSRSAAEIDRFWRAFDYGPFASPWGRPYMDGGDGRVEVVGLTPTGEASGLPPGTALLTDSGLRIACGDEWIAVGRVFRDGASIDPATALPDLLATDDRRAGA